jgi:hypothetical protein
MDTSKDRRERRARITAGVFCLIGIAVVVGMGLAGCGATTAPVIRTQSSTELAVEAISPEVMQECEGMPPPPANSVGDLLDDGTKAMALLAECRSRQHRLIQAVKPAIDAQRKAGKSD